MRVLFHDFHLCKQLLLFFFGKQESRVFFGHFNSDIPLIKLPGAFEDYAESTSSEEVIAIFFVEVGILALFFWLPNRYN